MARFEVRAPLPQFTGNVVGVDFVAGIAEVDTDNDAGRSAYAYFERAGYRLSPVQAEPEPSSTPEDDGPFDPSEHKADEVLAFLDSASYEVAVRVLENETAGKNRVTITGKRDEILADKTPAPADDQEGPQA